MKILQAQKRSFIQILFDAQQVSINGKLVPGNELAAFATACARGWIKTPTNCRMVQVGGKMLVYIEIAAEPAPITSRSAAQTKNDYQNTAITGIMPKILPAMASR